MGEVVGAMLARRDVLRAGAVGLAAALVQCSEEPSAPTRATPPTAAAPPSPPSVHELVEVLRTTPRRALLEALASSHDAGATLERFAEAAATLALSDCRHAAGGATGMVSHSLLSVGSAWRLAQRLPAERAAIPLLQVCHFVAGEASATRQGGRPYGPSLGPMVAPETSSEGDPRGALERSIVALDAMAADRATAELIAAGRTHEARGALTRAGLERFGHLGHGLIMATQTAELELAFGGRRPELLRAPARYLASFHVPNSAAGRVRRPEVGSHVARAAAALEAGETSAQVARAVAAQAARLLLRRPASQSLLGDEHLLTSTSAARRAAAAGHLSRDSGRLVLHAAAWLDLALAGESELGPLALADELPPALDGAATLPRLSSLALEGRIADVSGALAHSEPPEGFEAYLVELAVATGRATVQHSIKLTDAALLEAEDWRGAPEAGLHRACAMRLCAENRTRLDPLYREIVSALGLSPHPLLMS